MEFALLLAWCLRLTTCYTQVSGTTSVGYVIPSLGFWCPQLSAYADVFEWLPAIRLTEREVYVYFQNSAHPTEQQSHCEGEKSSRWTGGYFWRFVSGYRQDVSEEELLRCNDVKDALNAMNSGDVMILRRVLKDDAPIDLTFSDIAKVQFFYSEVDCHQFRTNSKQQSSCRTKFAR